MTVNTIVALSLTTLPSVPPHDEEREGLACSDEVNHN